MYKILQIKALKDILLVSVLALTSCSKITPDVKPAISYTPPPYLIESLPSPFEPITQDEKSSDYGKELFIAENLGKEQDLFGAVTAFKRARILSKGHETKRKSEIEYGLLLAYYLGNKYDAVCETFEKGDLQVSSKHFIPYNELLIILYDSYMKRGDKKRQETVHALIKKHSEPLTKKIDLYEAFYTADLNALPSDFQEVFQKNKKSPFKAGLLNAALPGAGYLYVGQKQTALTSFLLNALFIAASYEFLHHGQTAAGIITIGFETGWYLGGIHGAKEAAIHYNSTLYNYLANTRMEKERIFPLLMFEYGF